MTITAQELEQQVIQLKLHIKELQDELNYTAQSPYLQNSVHNLTYSIVLNRNEVMNNEFGRRINEKQGTMYEIKSQAKRMAELLGLDGDTTRIMVTEALQNILEHGYGDFVSIRLEADNRGVNPSLVCSFKQTMQPGTKYTLNDINTNALKGDITSEHFDFESSRGRGEFIMKELTDERRIINGIEIGNNGEKSYYFKRIMINYRYPDRPRDGMSFRELKEEIDRLSVDDVICCFHISRVPNGPDCVTLAVNKNSIAKVLAIMEQEGFEMKIREDYFRTAFATFALPEAIDREKLTGLFAKVRQVVEREAESSHVS